MKENLGAVDQAESERGDDDFPDRSDCKRPKALFTHIAEIRA